MRVFCFPCASPPRITTPGNRFDLDPALFLLFDRHSHSIEHYIWKTSTTASQGHTEIKTVSPVGGANFPATLPYQEILSL